MSPLRTLMIEAMILVGLAKGTQAAYVRAVWQLAAYDRRAPDQRGEEEVRRYLLDLRRRGVANLTTPTLASLQGLLGRLMAGL